MTGNANEWSKGRVRNATRVDEVPPLESVATAPQTDAKAGRFLPGNGMHRRRWLKAKAEGLTTIAPSSAPSWVRPHLECGVTYTASLLAMLEGRPALHPLAGDCADAHAMYRALLGLALATEDAKERASLLGEARGWLREHRTALATLSALAGDLKPPPGPEGFPWLVPAKDETGETPQDPAP